MIKLIADSGSTKTTWVLTEQGKIIQTLKTTGLNPYFHTQASVEEILRTTLIPSLPVYEIEEIHFYGAGCSTEENEEMISQALRKFIKNAEIGVYHDILGAARALFGDERGIAAILGTGCNSCYYDGKECFQEVDSLGFLFGDEGAGSNLGKRWMSAYLKKEAPADLIMAFDEQYRFSLSDILSSLYNRPYPNRYLASFSEFLLPQKDHPFVQSLIKSSFEAFISAQLQHYNRYQPIPVAFVGSIAWFYQDILKDVMEVHGYSIGTIYREPVEGLVMFHL
jgi:N-acetylglucosamine kinase-like BadF-type ATPase